MQSKHDVNFISKLFWVAYVLRYIVFIKLKQLKKKNDPIRKFTRANFWYLKTKPFWTLLKVKKNCYCWITGKTLSEKLRYTFGSFKQKSGLHDTNKTMLCYCIVSTNVYFPWQVWLLTNLCMHLTTKLCSRKHIQIPILLYNILTKKSNIATSIGFQYKYRYQIANESEIIIRYWNNVLVLYHLTKKSNHFSN